MRVAEASSLRWRHRRIPVRLSARCVAERRLMITRTEDVSKSGAFLRSRTPPSVGTIVTLGLNPPGAGTPINVHAEVMWRRPAGDNPGFGVRYVARNRSTIRQLDALMGEVRGIAGLGLARVA